MTRPLRDLWRDADVPPKLALVILAGAMLIELVTRWRTP